MNPYTNERDSDTVQVCDCTTKESLIDLIDTTYTNKMYHLFSVAYYLRTPKLSMLDDLEQLWGRWPPGKSPRKHVNENETC